MKRCTKCREEKPLAEFYAHRHTRDRLQSWCRGCMSGFARHAAAVAPQQSRRAKWAAIAAAAAEGRDVWP